MRNLIGEYVGLFSNIIPEKTRLETVKYLEEYEQWSKHTYDLSRDSGSINYDDDFDVCFDYPPSHNEKMDIIHKCLGQYLNQLDMKWFNSWNGFTPLRYNKYNKGTNMKIHCDHIHSIFDGRIKGVPILTILGLLNDDFEGGEFTMWDNDETVIPFKKGDILIFPSNFLYPHRVKSVTNGTRYSFVSWCF